MNSIDYEFYETADPLTRWLFNYMGNNVRRMHGAMFEPCVGAGAIPRASGLTTPWMINDVDPRWCSVPMDATKRDVWTPFRIDWTVTNPPFTAAIPILSNALEHSRIGVAMYLRLSIHEPLKTGERRTFFAKHKPSVTLMLPRFGHQRSKSTGAWSHDSMTSCWCVWVKGETRQIIDYAPESVMDELAAFTPDYQQRMDALMGYTGTESERQAQCVARWRVAA
jgi:hypothetical protein